MAGEDNILNLFIRANIDDLAPKLDAAVATFKAGVDSMKGAAATLPESIDTSVASAAASFISLNPVLQDLATNVLDLKAAYADARADIKETEDIIAEAGGTTEVTSGIIRQYAEETARVTVLQRALSDATKEYDATLRGLLNDQILAAEAARAGAIATSQSTQASATAVITDEARARVKAELARLDALGAAAATESANVQTGAARSNAAATETTAVAANTASEAYLRLARATIANAQAQAEVRAIMSGAAEMVGLEGQFTNELALAQERAAATTAELVAAQRALTVATEQVAAATEVASAAQNTFRGRMALSEYGVRGFISSSITSLPLLAGIFAATFAVRAVEAIQKTELELANLSVLTGESIRNLYDLGRAAEASGARSDDLTAAFRRLDKTISDAASGNESARLTLRELGVDMTEINSGIVPKTSTVLAQMADYLHVNAGNAEIMRAAMRALGSDSVALAAFLSQGSQAVRQQSERFAETGTQMQLSAGEARKLSQTQAELGATYDRLKLSLLPLVNDFISFEKVLARITGVADAFTAALKGLDEVAKLLRGDFSSLKAPDFILSAPKLPTTPGPSFAGIPALTPPVPPVFAETKTTKPKAGPAEKSDLPEFREELAQQEALFDGSRAEMLTMELAFWERLISTGRVKARDLIAVHAEISRAEIQLRREVVREAEAESRELVALTRSGSQDRVNEALRNMELERALHKEGSIEFANAQKEYLLAVRDRVQETIRLQVQSAEESAGAEERGSAERVSIYQSTLESLRTSLAAINDEVKHQQDIWTSTADTAAHQRMLIASGESEFIAAEIHRVTREVEAAEAERTEALNREALRRERLIIDEATQQAAAGVRTAAVTGREDTQAIDRNKLLFTQERITLLRQVAEAEYFEASAAIDSARTIINAQLAIATTDRERALAKEKLIQLDREQAAVDAALMKQELDADNRLAQQQQANALKVGNVISTSFTGAFDKMLTAHTNFATVMANFWNNMVVGFARMGIQILADWLKLIAARVVAWIAGEKIQTAAAATGAEERKGIGLIETLKSIGRAAAKAAANVFAWVMEVVPFPFNVILAPVAAAAAFAGVLAFGALASAAGGAVLDKDTLVQAHAREMILPATISTGLRGLIESGGAGVSAGTSIRNNSSSSSKTVHVRPQITVNQMGGDSRMSTEEISSAVLLGIRKGLVNV